MFFLKLPPFIYERITHRDTQTTDQTSEALGRLGKTQAARPTPRISDSVGLEWGLRIGFSSNSEIVSMLLVQVAWKTHWAHYPLADPFSHCQGLEPRGPSGERPSLAIAGPLDGKRAAA